MVSYEEFVRFLEEAPVNKDKAEYATYTDVTNPNNPKRVTAKQQAKQAKAEAKTQAKQAKAQQSQQTQNQQTSQKQVNTDAPEYKNGKGYNAEFLTYSKSGLDRIGHNEVKNYTAKIIDTIKKRNDALGKGVEKVEYIDWHGEVKEQPTEKQERQSLLQSPQNQTSQLTQNGTQQIAQNSTPQLTAGSTNSIPVAPSSPSPQLQPSNANAIPVSGAQRESLVRESALKRFKEADAQNTSAQNTNQTNNSQNTQKNNSSDTKVYMTADEQEKREQKAEDKKSEQLPLPQPLTFRIHFNQNCMYWVFRSYNNLGNFLNQAEVLKEEYEEGKKKYEALQKQLPEPSEESKEESSATKEALEFANSYLLKLQEENESSEGPTVGQVGATIAHGLKGEAKNAKNSVKDKFKSDKEYIKNSAKDAWKKYVIDIEKERGEDNASLANGEKNKYLDDFLNMTVDVRNTLVSTLQEGRKAELESKPVEQWQYYPNFAVEDGETPFEYPTLENLFSKDLQTKLDSLGSKIKDTKVVQYTGDDIKNGEVNNYPEFEKLHGEVKKTLLDLSNDEKNRFIDLQVYMIPWNKASLSQKILQSKALGGLAAASKSAQKLGAMFTGHRA